VGFGVGGRGVGVAGGGVAGVATAGVAVDVASAEAAAGVEPGGATVDWSGVTVAFPAGVDDTAANGSALWAAGVLVADATRAAGVTLAPELELLAELPVAKPKVITTRPAVSSG
jgi:hypothetical protein